MRFLNNKLIRWGVIPFLLLGLWLILSVNYVRENTGLTILLENYSRKNIRAGKDTELLRGQKINAEFQSRQNYMGIVAVRFNTFRRINNDLMIFRIKEKGQKSWYYEYTYKVDQFQPDGLFTFGFPIIENSKNKTYHFELESTKGEPEDAVALSYIEPVFVSKHEYSKSTLLKDSNVLWEFLKNKTENSVKNFDFINNSVVYLMPFIFYMIYQLVFAAELNNPRSLAVKSLKSNIAKSDSFKNFYAIGKPAKYVIIICVLFVFYDIYFVSKISQTSILIVLAIWIFVITKFKLISKVSFVLAFFFLILAPIFFYIRFGSISEKLALWSYIFLAIGTIQQIIELRKTMK